VHRPEWLDASLNPALSAAAKAFELFEAGKLSGSALLLALRVSPTGSDLSDDPRLRALIAVEAERLSEDVLTRVLDG
jgi:hypothetical protein